jgi:phage terminase large subunit-like protein
VYSDEEPDQLRGFSGDTAWLDEMAKFVNAEDTWHCLQFGMRERSSDRPRILITTTPRPLSILRQIERLPSTVLITGSSYENARNLDPHWFDDVVSRYEGTRLGRQEIMAEILEDVPGALWTREVLDKCRVVLDGAFAVRRRAAEPPADLPVVVGVWAGEVRG